jgi:hypothetical protein
VAACREGTRGRVTGPLLVISSSAMLSSFRVGYDHRHRRQSAITMDARLTFWWLRVSLPNEHPVQEILSGVIFKRAQRVSGVLELYRCDLMHEVREVIVGKMGTRHTQARGYVGLEYFEVAIFLVKHRDNLSLGDGSRGASGRGI